MSRRYPTEADARAVGDLLPPLGWLVCEDTRTGRVERRPIKTRRGMLLARRGIAQDRLARPWLQQRIEWRNRRARNLQGDTDSSAAQ